MKTAIGVLVAVISFCSVPIAAAGRSAVSRDNPAPATDDSRTNVDCPEPSIWQAGECVLRSDAVLSDTMWIPSRTTLNCQGHRLTPATAGVLDDPRTTTNEFIPSPA